MSSGHPARPPRRPSHWLVVVAVLALIVPAGTVGGQVVGGPIALSMISGFGANVATWLATPSSANLAGAVTGETGSGALVFATSPALVTPDLGTPSAGTLTNATGLPVATGISGLGSGVATWLGTPSSANLATAVTGETGSGALVFATSPALTTPDLGTPSAATLTNATGLPIATGVSGLGAGCATFLTTPSGTNFFGCITNESGTSGSVMRATGATATSLTVNTLLSIEGDLHVTATSGNKLILGQADGLNARTLTHENIRVEYEPASATIDQLQFNRITCHGDNTTSRGCIAGFFVAEDDSTVNSSNKGILIGFGIQVIPTEARNNSPVDDVVGLHLTNYGTDSATDALYIGDGPNVSGDEWVGGILVVDAGATYGIRLNGDVSQAHFVCGADAGDDCKFRTTIGNGSGDQFLFQRGNNGATVQAIIDATGLTLAAGSRVDIGAATGDSGTTCTAFTGGICTTATSPEWDIFDLHDELQALRAEVAELRALVARFPR